MLTVGYWPTVTVNGTSIIQDRNGSTTNLQEGLQWWKENKSWDFKKERWEKTGGGIWKKGVIKQGKEKRGELRDTFERSKRKEGGDGREKSGGKRKRGSCENVRRTEQWVMQKGGMEFAQKQEPRQMCSCQGVLFSLKTSFRLRATCFNTHGNGRKGRTRERECRRKRGWVLNSTRKRTTEFNRG